MNKIKSEEIKKNVCLHTLNEDKFKTNLINFYFQRPLIKEEVTYNALLPMVLQRGTNTYKTSKDLSKKLEDLYGAYVFGDVAKKGERQIIRFSMSVADENYIGKGNVLQEGVELANDILINPILDNDSFIKSYVNQEKENLKNRINSRINDKMKYAIDRCIEIMCKDENYGIYEYGNVLDLEDITAESLYNHYKKVITTSPLDIIAVGNMKHNDIKEILLNTLKINIDEIVYLENKIEEVKHLRVKEIKEKADISQGKLTLGYRTNIPYYDTLYPALMLYSSILGGGAHSKLFIKVREENSLCYYIFSRVEKYKSLMLISSGIEIENFEMTKDVIARQLIEMEKGNITDQEIDYAKKSIINSIREFGDSSSSLAEYLYGQVFSNNIEPIEDLIIKIESVTIDQIVEVAKKIKLDTIYFLTNEA
ncbi:EF-P 5-aminopentanol modification-associated protein YfmF [Alkaliphilus sp. B6464]|uniref:EF-P 5-aminopentanol modification-associated protein YfmF n=1 Tax=Alkaliphilus sp. B6464 TaxID=2731219 RepID=UPI001BAE2397|nr:pitrilysin family protein [Alkaliphilus sp. B6464]QUH20962.1 insulinase family protein [Alkaliphilus sp. B6464]